MLTPTPRHSERSLMLTPTPRHSERSLMLTPTPRHSERSEESAFSLLRSVVISESPPHNPFQYFLYFALFWLSRYSLPIITKPDAHPNPCHSERSEESAFSLLRSVVISESPPHNPFQYFLNFALFWLSRYSLPIITKPDAHPNPCHSERSEESAFSLLRSVVISESPPHNPFQYFLNFAPFRLSRYSLPFFARW
ncbi:MAG: hypothetical protein ACOX3G_07295 [Armatimonadota bacterium]